MVEKRTCDYTGEEIEPGTGIMYVRTDGSVLHFVDSKAEKNYLMGREARDLEWTEAGRREKGPRQPLGAVDDGADEATTEEESDVEADAEPDADQDADAGPDADAEADADEDGDSDAESDAADGESEVEAETASTEDR